jgi:pyrroloquinoline quinone biosynthesis protein B
LWPLAGRGSPVAGIVLTNGDLDHVLGLFSLRESTPLFVYATESVFRALRDKNIMMRTLERFDGQLTFRQLTLGKETPLLLPSGEPSGLSIVAHPAPGKVPVHLVGAAPASPEDNIAVEVREDGNPHVATYATAVAALESGSALVSSLETSRLVFFDGTFWQDDELITLGLGKARARDMAHIPIAGENGSLAALSSLGARKVYMHINNTNPILDESSVERGEVTKAGWEVATDGMELSL